MELSELLTLIGFGLVYVGALIATITNIRIKIKELEVKIMNVQNELQENKVISECRIQKLEERNTKEHDAISSKVDALTVNLYAKIDSLLEKIIELKVQAAKKDKE